MGSENEIQRWAVYPIGGSGLDFRKHDEGGFVQFSDHVAVRKADQERIDELEARAKGLERPTHMCENGRVFVAPKFKGQMFNAPCCGETGDPCEVFPIRVWLDYGRQVEQLDADVYELEASLAAAEKLADAVKVWADGFGYIPDSGVPVNEPYSTDEQNMVTALAAFRASLSTGEREGVVEGGSAAGVTKNDGVNTTEGEDENCGRD